MKHYEERLQHDLQAIKDDVASVGEMVGSAIDDAVRALLAHDLALASATILGDLPINRKTRSIDRKCHAFVARHLPTAGHLRFVSSTLRMTVALERIGDYAATIAKEAVQLEAKPPEVVTRDVQTMTDQTTRMLRQAMRAFGEANADLARGTMGMEAQVDATFDNVFTDLLREGESGKTSIRDLFALLMVFNRIERTSDQAKNLCEETVFAATGETKVPKRYRVLFVDEKNDRRSPMAAALAARAFPESGSFSSAGWAPADAFDADLIAYMAERVNLAGATPSELDTSRSALDDFHVIVGLDRGTRSHIPELPFKTVLVEWHLESAPSDLETTHKELSLKIRDLMVTLRGEDAA